MGQDPKKINKYVGEFDPGAKLIAQSVGKDTSEVVDPLGLFSAGFAPIPELDAVEAMPTADDEALSKARKRAVARRGGSGRASTFISLGSGAGTKTVGG